VKIEHVNGILKETFCSLKELRVEVNSESPQTIEHACNWIRACLILYNIILPFDDFISNFDGNFEGNNVDDNENNDYFEENTDGKERRRALCEWVMERV